MKERPYKEKTLEESERMASRAKEVLRQNDMGGWTKAAPDLYPHQWSWDSAFIAIGLAHFDGRRAARELLTLFDNQWKTGKVPHIVFNSEAPPESYFPGADHWACAAESPDAPPAPPYTSCLCQPPVHAIAALRIREAAASEEETAHASRFLVDIYSKLFDWHKYLATFRDPEESGLVTIFHPWESGTDNSPRWNDALAAVEVGDLSSYVRYDLKHVEDASQRPTDAEYDRYLWLVQSIKREQCDEEAIYESHPFLVKDVLFSSILVAANRALLKIAEMVGASEEDRAEIWAWIQRGLKGLESLWNPELGLYLDYDLRGERPMRTRTVAGFAPLIAGHTQRLEALLETLDSPAFLGHPGLRLPLPPSTSPGDPEFHPRSYWRGPVWPVANWLLWRSLLRAGETQRAGRLRLASLKQLADEGFGEYFEPFTGKSLGSDDQSWTAAVALDWLASREGEAA